MSCARVVRGRARAAAGAVAVVFGLAATAGTASAVTLTPLSTGFNSPVGIDYHEPSKKVIMSVNYPTGQPYNFELVAADGGRTQFSAIHGLTDELKLATVRSGPCQGGFATGELFTGNGKPGEVVRVSPDGSTIQDPWVTLADPGLMRGGLFQDRFCVAGGDLIIVTTAGGVWRIKSDGSARQLASLGVHLEGVTTIPDDPAKYGPWAGKILTGAENEGLFWTIDPTTGAATSYSLGVNPEDVDIVPPNENFFGVNFGGSQLMGAPASEFCNIRGDVVSAQESGVLWDVHWSGTQFVTTNLAQVTQWEHVTFAPVGIVEIPPPPAASIDDVTVDESAGTATFTVKLSHAVNGPCPDPVSLKFATANGSATAPADYGSTNGTLTFAPGEDTKTITVPIVDDSIAENDENFFVGLSGPLGATIADDRGVGTIIDNDARISINDVTVTEGDAGTTPATFNVTLSHSSSKTITVQYATADGTATAPADYGTTSGTVTFAPGETSKAVVVQVRGDTIDEPNETFTVKLSQPTNAAFADDTGVGTIIDDDRNGAFSCRASALRLTGLLEPVAANRPNAPCRDDSSTTLQVGLIGGTLTANLKAPNARTDQTPDDLQSAAPAIGDRATAHADTSDASISVSAIAATSTAADASAECTSSGVPTLTSSSKVVGLHVNGQAYDVLTQPVTIPLVLATLRINATINEPGRITRRAIWLDNAILPDVVIGEVIADYSGNPCTA
ncbi:MAG TPA: choice-of-anchor P family protein [Solirubrobacteraceae bacterium]|jgi:hypothetical protein